MEDLGVKREPLDRVKFSPELKKGYGLPEWVDGYWDMDTRSVHLRISTHCVTVTSEELWNEPGYREHIVFDMARRLLHYVQGMLEGEVMRIGSTRLSALIILYAEHYYQWKMDTMIKGNAKRPDPVEFVIDKLKEVT